MSNLVTVNASEFGIEETKAAQIAEQFKPMLDKMVELENEYNQLTSKISEAGNITPTLSNEAKVLRLKYVKVRTGTAEIHKQQKAFYLAAGRFVDAWKNTQLFASESIEEKLKEIEEHQQRIEAQRIVVLQTERSEQLAPYGIDTTHLNLGIMSDEVWSNFLIGTIANYNAKIEAEKKAEEERLAAIEAERQRIEAQRIENERLKKEAEEREEVLRKEREAAELERKRIEAENEAKLQAERERAEKEKAEQDARLEAERKERERVEAELKAKQEAEEKARKEAEKLAKKQAAAPDKDKLILLSNQLKSIQLPELKTEEANAILRDVQILIGKVCSHIESKCAEL